jgi:hypothetical protein
MNEKDIQILIELAEAKIRERVSAAEALQHFVEAGIMDADGNYTAPYQEMLDNPE